MEITFISRVMFSREFTDLLENVWTKLYLWRTVSNIKFWQFFIIFGCLYHDTPPHKRNYSRREEFEQPKAKVENTSPKSKCEIEHVRSTWTILSHHTTIYFKRKSPNILKLLKSISLYINNLIHRKNWPNDQISLRYYSDKVKLKHK